MGVQLHRLSRAFTLYLCCVASQDQKRMDNHNQMKREQYEPDEPAGVWAEWLGGALGCHTAKCRLLCTACICEYLRLCFALRYREEKAVEDISDEDESLGWKMVWVLFSMLRDHFAQQCLLRAGANASSSRTLGWV